GAGPPSGGASWHWQSDGGWTGTWTRRGTSDVFDSQLSNGSGARVRIVEQVSITGRHFHSQRLESPDDHILCTLDGELDTSGRTYSGTAQCPGGPNGWAWRITPAGFPFPPW